ncbi:MAG: sulfatase-like hydrolase/transferase [Planctomycetes bacterium]|nr:sulfatase-like hydrolase/transferase [Planctomycetota bacterium]
MARTDRPNILWIMSDQHRADALGAVTPWMHTPSLDHLAAEGVSLRRMFAQSPVCVPSRSNFVTGRYPHSHRVRENNSNIGPGEPHLFRILKDRGYKTGLVGKNHMFYPRDLEPLDICRADLKSGGTPEWEAHLKAIREDMYHKGSWAGARFHDLPEEHSSTYKIGQAGLDALDAFAKQDDPFFLWVSFQDPHAPHTAPRRLSKLYPEDKLPLDKSLVGPTRGHEVNGKSSRMSVKREAQLMDAASESDLRRYMAVYSSMITLVDEQIGKILSKLDELGKRENTLVIYVSDHGDFRADHGMVKKDLVLYDCLLNIPCVLRYPGVLPAGAVRHALAEQIDLHPTICHYAGAAAPKGVQGLSLDALLEGSTDRHRDEVHAEICPPLFENPYSDFPTFISEWKRSRDEPGHPLRYSAPFNVPGDHVKMVRTPTHKYIWLKRGEEELYDLEADPGERRNLARDPARQAECAAFRARLFEWCVRSEDPRDLQDDRDIARQLPWGEPIVAWEAKPKA